MQDSRLPAGVTQSDIDGPADPRDSMCDDELWDCLSDRQQDAIQTDFLNDYGADLIADFEDGAKTARQLRGTWRAYRDAAVERLLFNGMLRLPDDFFGH